MKNKTIRCVACGVNTMHDTSAICIPSRGKCIRIKSKTNYNEEHGNFCMTCALEALKSLEFSGLIERVNVLKLQEQYFCGFISTLSAIIEFPKEIESNDRLSVIEEAIAELKTWPFKCKKLENGLS